MSRLITILLLCACGARAAQTNILVQVTPDGSQTVPPNTFVTPAQITNQQENAGTVYSVATGLAARAEVCVEKQRKYGTNFVVTSTVYVQSIGGVPYDPSNQTVIVRSVTVGATNVSVLATVRQTPLVAPVLDWRVALAGGAWSNAQATVSAADIPAGVTNAAAAYLFTLARPGTGSAFFRVVDNSTGASGSGLWWIVFGGIWVDGRQGRTASVTNGADVLDFKGGILVEPDPLGGF